MKSILIIEDNEEMKFLLEHLLRKSGYNTLAASDGDEGLKLFETHPVDLILTDIFMPHHSGFEVIKTLQSKRPGLKIIAMSGHFLPTSDRDRKLAEILGILKTFSKPFDPQNLVDYINSVLQDPSAVSPPECTPKKEE